MKKFIFLLAFFFLASFSFVSAQNAVSLVQGVTLDKETKFQPRELTRDDALLFYYNPTCDYITQLGNITFTTNTYYMSACIDFTAGQVSNYAGGEITSIGVFGTQETMLPGYVSSKAWIKESLSGALVAEQDFTLTPWDWNDIELTTPYLLTGTPLVIGYTHIFTVTGTNIEIRPFALTVGSGANACDAYVPGGCNYAMATTANYGAGASWNQYTATGNLLLDAYVEGFSPLPDNDLAATLVSCLPLKWVGKQDTYAITVINSGTTSQNNFTVQLIDASNTTLASQVVSTPLASGASTTINLTYTPTTAGTFPLRGRVVLAGDENPSNDATDPVNFKFYPMQPMGYCTTQQDGAYGPGADNPCHATIGYLAADMGQFVGKKLTELDICLPASPSAMGTGTIWVRNAYNAATNLYEQSFTPVEGWQTITLTTPYDLENQNTFIGYTLSNVLASNYPLGYSINSPANANGGHFAINTSWYTLIGQSVTGNMNIVGGVENAPAGACNPPENLAVSMQSNCDALLTWQPPTGKKSITNGYIMPYEEMVARGLVPEKGERGERGTKERITTAARTAKDMQVMNNQSINQFIPVIVTPDPFGNIPRAPRGMVNVTLEGHNPWNDGSGVQLLLDNTATQYGLVIPENGAEIGSYYTTNCSVPADGWDVFSNLLPANATCSCTSTGIVVNGTVTIQIPAGTYDWGMANPCPNDRIWAVGAGGGAGTEGRRDNYVFEDGYDYHFYWQLFEDTGNDGVIITTELIGDPCPTVSNVIATANNNNVTITWTAASGSPLSYDVMRNGTQIGNVTTTTYTDTNVPVGQYTYSVKAIFPAGDDCIPIAVNAPQIIVGDVCFADIITTDYDYGDSFSWWLKDNATNIPIIGAGNQSGFGPIATGTLTAMLTGDATFELWQHGSYTDNGITLSINVNGTPVYSFSLYNIPSGFTTSGDVPCEGGNPPGNITYKVYRGSELLGTTTELTFTDTDWDHMGATWSVTAICEEGGESNPAEVVGAECEAFCPPVTNFSVVYNAGCGAELTWDAAKASRDCDDYTIGTGTSNYFCLPTDYYQYSYNQQLFYASEIDFPTGGMIQSISYQFTSATPLTRTMTLYMVNTNKTSFSSSSDWITTGLTQVYQGSFTFNNSGPNNWITIQLQTPFEYTGGNLVVAFLNSTGTQGSGGTFSAFDYSDTRTIYQWSSTVLVDPFNPVAGSGAFGYRNNTRFNVCSNDGPGGGDGKTFIITRDTEEIAQVTEPFYSDYGFDYMLGHTWGVKVICDDDLESDEVTQTLDACDAEGNCNPAQNLEGEYTMMCDIVLTWEPPVGKKMTNIYTPPATSEYTPIDPALAAQQSAYEQEKEKTIQKIVSNTIDESGVYSGPYIISDLSRGEYIYGVQGYTGMDVGHFKISLANPGLGTLQTPFNQGTLGGEFYDGYYYCSSNATGFVGAFYKVDHATGSYTQIATHDSYFNDMTYDYSTNTMYGLRTNTTTYTSTIYTIDLNTGAQAIVATLTGMSGSGFITIACNVSGDMYGITLDGAGATLYSINLSASTCTSIGSTGLTSNFAQGSTFDHETGIYYWCNYRGSGASNLCTVNLSTGTATPVNSNAIGEICGAYIPYVANQNIAKAPTNFTGEQVGNTYDVALSWTNPSQTLGGETLTAITSIVLQRDGTTIQTYNNPTVGGNMNFTDTEITANGTYNYKVYAVTSEGNSGSANVSVKVKIMVAGCDDAEVITGTSNIGGSTGVGGGPAYFWYRNSYVQQIFTASEIGYEGEDATINSISYQYVYGTSYNLQISVYMANTTKSTFASAAAGEFVPLSALELVFEGTVNFTSADEWTLIDFDTPFEYTGDNVVVAVVSNRGSGWSYFGDACFKGGAMSNKVITSYNDTYAQDPASPGTNGTIGLASNRSNIMFNVCTGGTLYNVYRDGVWQKTLKETTYTDTGFDPTELHHWKVTVTCEDGGESAGIYLTKNACAGCYGPENLEVEYSEDCEGAFLMWEEPTGKKSGTVTKPTEPTEYTFIPREGGMNTGNTLSIKNENPVTPPTQSGSKNPNSEVLWDNTNINIGTGGLISAYWSGNDNWVWTADDFDADTPWIIEKVISQGFSNAPSALPTKMDVAIFTNAAGSPGTEIYRNKAIPVTDGANPEIILPTPFQLPAPGKYWIAIAGAYDATVTDNVQAGNYRWNIYHGTTPKGDVFQLYDKLGIFGSGASTWLDGSSLVAGSYSMYFRIEGLIGGDLCDPVTNLSATVQGKNVKLSWTAPAGSPIGYEIIRDGQSLNTVTTTTYTDTQVPDGFHTYGVKALFADDCYPVLVNAPEVLVGDLCSVEVVISYVGYGDEINWAIKDANGTTLAGAGPQVNGGNISTGTFTTLFAGEATFRFWNGGGGGYGDNSITIAVNYDGEQIYYLDMSYIPVGYNGGEIPFECITGTSFNFNIYRDGELVAEEVNDLSYFDTGFDHSQSHTWCVVSICEDGSESLPACKEMAKCSCDPVENLDGYYNENCEVVLSWDQATGKSIIYTPEDIEIDPIAEAANAALIQQKDQEKMLQNQNSPLFTLSGLTHTNSTNITVAPDDWTGWCGYENSDAIGTGGALDWKWGARFTPADLASKDILTGDIITDVRFLIYYPYVFTSCAIEIYQGGTWPSSAGTLVYSQDVPVSTLLDNQWVEYELITPVIVDASQELWIVIQSAVTGLYTGGVDFGPPVSNKGNIVYFEGAWSPLTDLNAALTYNWQVQAFVATGNVNLAQKPTNFTAEQIGNTFNVGLSWTNPTQTLAGAPLTSISQIVLERDGTPISTFNNPAVGGNMTFTDNVPDNGTYNYQVYAVTGEGNGSSATTSLKVKVKLCNDEPTDVIIGNTDLSSSYGCPVYFYYNNSYTQQIYTADEIGSGGTIVSVAYNYIFTTPKDLPYKIYMGNTTKGSFASGSAAEFVPLSDLTLVYDGTASFNASNPWSVVELDIPFKYEGENLVIATVCNRGSGWTSSAHFRGGTVSGNRSIRCYQDGAAIDPANLGASGNMFAVDPQLANIRFGMCPVPYNIYEDGVLIEQNYQGTTYIYNALEMTPWNTHTYEVSVVCLNGKESPKAAITLEPCEYLERVSGYVFNCVTELPMEGVTTVISYLELETTTNAEGFYTYPYVNCDKYQTVTGSMPGFYTNTTEPFFVECGDDNMAPDLCLQPIPEWIVFGDVRGCDDSYIVGALVTLVSGPESEHYYEFETTTGQFGQFEFPDVYMCQPNEYYILTVTKQGWDGYESQVLVIGNVNVGRIILYNIIEEPTNAAVTEATDYQSATITWTAAPAPLQGVAEILGYKVWRLLPGQETNETLWSILTSEPVNDVVLIDNAWANYTPGTYKYAVKTAYCGDLLSAPIFTNEIVKNIEVGFEIKITTECENNPLGAVVTLTNTDYQYELISTSTGAFFPKVWLGTYNLKVTLAGYTDYTATVEVTAAGSYDVVLQLIVKDPADVKIDTLGNTAHLTWSFDAVVPYAGFTIYLNGEVMKTGVTTTEYYFADLEDGDYTAEVEANYCATISSAKIPVTFTILTVGIDVYEFDYNLYPNPTTEMITVQRSNACEATIELYNAMGMHISTYETTEHQLEINVGSLAVGTYFIRINEGDKSTVKSFVKK